LHTEKRELEGIVGYVPQDDLLIEELTVYQNLFYNTRLCFAGYSDEKIVRLVKKSLLDLGLDEIADLRVGNPLNKTISGGQRKRLNIALELIREPAVLFVDEPTSGLSSRDSENSMDLLKELSLKGKLVFVVIHQPSSDIYKMFDKLLILDLGGYPIYYGNPVEALVYFKTAVNHINARDAQCEICGTVNPEQLFNIIEAKVLDENGTPTHMRRISPQEWNDLYLKNTAVPAAIENTPSASVKKDPIETNFKKPGFFRQMKVYLSRDILAKLSNAQYLAINFLEAPFLAFILAFLTKFYRNGSTYVFSENKNLVAYIFMCVVVSLFVGLTVSAEEIIHDRKILRRESFLNLSRGAYLLSKILLLFFISAVQAGTFVLVGNTILEIHGMYLAYWLVLFSTACFANMLGLNISAGFDNVVTIYILIPFLLIPQLLLSGVIVKFDELHPALSGKSVVPLTGDLMTSRWAFEALAVHQFQKNAYERNIYLFEKAKSRAKFKKDEWTNQMNEAVKSGNLHFLSEEIKAEQQESGIPFNYFRELLGGTFDDKEKSGTSAFIEQVRMRNLKIYNEASKNKDAFFSDYLATEEGRKNIEKLRNENQNDKLKDFVTNYPVMGDNAFVEENRLFQSADPVYMDAVPGTFLRAQFCAPRKFLFGTLVSTYWSNLLVIWFMAGILGLTLYFDLFRKGLEGLGRLASRKHNANA
jgi:ABC-type multidrug transport system ATPase subunit